MPASFRNTSCKLHTLLLLTAHCLGFNHMDIPAARKSGRVAFIILGEWYSYADIYVAKNQILIILRKERKQTGDNQQSLPWEGCVKPDPEESMMVRNN